MGITATRAFPTNAYPAHLDPFVLFEQFSIDPETGFPMHEHRGFEIVSYMIEGGMEHEDSLGVERTAYEGDAIGITTGSGIQHSEFSADGKACTGLQLWVNLPRERKDADPRFVDADAADLPEAETNGARVTTVVGEKSPIDLCTRLKYLDVHVTDSWTWDIPAGWTGFLYVLDGSGSIEETAIDQGDVTIVIERESLTVASSGSLRAVAVSGRPHGEPITQRGPFVL